MKKISILLLSLLMAWGVSAQKPGDVVILYDNDVHCAIDGYPVMAGLRDSLSKKGCEVMVVSAGDFSFGGPVGAASKGDFVIRMMNAVGYDVVTLGNHEFDYGMTQLRVLQDKLTAPMLCCNLKLTADPTLRPFSSFVVRNVGGKKIGFVGVTTPTTLNTSSPTSFQDVTGKFIYNFSTENLAALVQREIDACRAAGAEVVVLLCHLGDADGVPTSMEVASKLNDIDLVIDGHDHHDIVVNATLKNGNKVTLTSTGSMFQNVGMAVLPLDMENNKLTAKLLSTNNLRKAGCVSKSVNDSLTVIKQLFDAMGSRVVATTEYRQVAIENDIRVVRLRETNLGDLIADAFRHSQHTDIGWANSGGIRADLPVGPITHNQLFSVSPYSNKVCVIRAKGSEILNALETAVRQYPKAEGCFPQVSGLSFEFDPSVPSGVVLDENGRFLRVDGQYRVSNVKVGMKPLEMEDTYTIAGVEYVLINGGDAIYFPTKEIVKQEKVNDLDIIEAYLQETLHGTIGKPYDMPQGRIIMK